jgi:MoxR-like ATPase
LATKQQVWIAKRAIQSVRDALRTHWHGLTDARLGYLTDWLLATCIARENALLLGRPGVAKTEMATVLFQYLGLSSPAVSRAMLEDSGTEVDIFDAWEKKGAEARKQPKYFHYLLHRFVQIEELFGPVDVSLLKKGVLARVNFGLLTGPGVHGCFLDEVGKATGALLNALLGLLAERQFFQWGGMKPSDLKIVIGASNEMPGALGGMGGATPGGDDFRTMYAFVDRFCDPDRGPTSQRLSRRLKLDGEVRP